MPRFEYELDPIQQLSLQNFSYSRLSTYQECALRYFYQYILKVPAVYGQAATLGNIIHEALENTLRDGEKVDQKELLGNYREAIVVYDPERQIPPSMIADGSDMLTEFVKANPGKQRVYKNELEFTFIIGRGRFNGFIDNVAEHDDYVHITDYKCVTEHTVFWRPDGTQCTVADLEVGDQVVGYHSASHDDDGLYPTTITAIEDNGKDSVVVIVTNNGRRLMVTKKHPVLTNRGWVNAGDLGVDDQVVVALGLYHMHTRYGAQYEEDILPDQTLLAEFTKIGPQESYLRYREDLFKADVDTHHTFFIALFDRKIKTTVRSYSEARDVQSLLAYTGFNSRTYLSGGIWFVEIVDSSKIAFLNFINKWKIPALTETYDRVVSVQPVGAMQTWAVTVDKDHTHVTDGIVTHNSGKWEVPNNKIPINLQLGIYAMFIKKLFPEKDVYAELYYLRSGKRKGHRFTSDDLSEHESKVIEIVEEILETEDFKPTTNEWNCRMCSYAKDGTCAIGGNRLRKAGVLA